MGKEGKSRNKVTHFNFKQDKIANHTLKQSDKSNLLLFQA